MLVHCRVTPALSLPEPFIHLGVCIKISEKIGKRQTRPLMLFFITEVESKNNYYYIYYFILHADLNSLYIAYQETIKTLT